MGARIQDLPSWGWRNSIGVKTPALHGAVASVVTLVQNPNISMYAANQKIREQVFSGWSKSSKRGSEETGQGTSGQGGFRREG